MEKEDRLTPVNVLLNGEEVFIPKVSVTAIQELAKRRGGDFETAFNHLIDLGIALDEISLVAEEMEIRFPHAVISIDRSHLTDPKKHNKLLKIVENLIEEK